MSDELNQPLEVADVAETDFAESAADTPETEISLESADLQESVETEEITESAETSESVETQAVQDEAEADIFADLLPSIPTDTEIDTKFNRVPKEARAELKRLANVATTSQRLVEAVGGEFGVTAFTPFAKVLSKPSASDEELKDVAGALIDANPQVTTALFTGAAQFLLTTPQFANELLPSVFGDNATLDNIKHLLKLDKAGFIDKDQAQEYLGEDYAYTDRYEAQERQIAELRAQLEVKQNPQKQPEPVNVRNDRDAQAFEQDYYSETKPALQPAFERARWNPDGALAKLVTEVLQIRNKQDAKFQDTIAYLKQNGNYRTGDKRHILAETNLHLLKNKTLAEAMNIIREINADIKGVSEGSRNAALVKKKAAATTHQPKSVPMANNPQETPAQRQERADRKFKEFQQAMREAKQASRF